MIRARSAFQAGEYAVAASIWAQVASASPPDALSALNNRAAALHELGDFGGAAEAARAAIDLDSACLKAHYRYAKSCLALGATKEAIQACRSALELEPEGANHAQLLELQGACESRCCDGVPCRTGCSAPRVAAEEHYTSDCEAAAFGALTRGEDGQAVAWFSRALAFLEESVSEGDGARRTRLLGGRARGLLALGRLELAAADCEAAASLDPALVTPRVTGASAFARLGQTRRAATLAAEAEAAAAAAAAERVKLLRALPASELLRRLRDATGGRAQGAALLRRLGTGGPCGARNPYLPPTQARWVRSRRRS